LCCVVLCCVVLCCVVLCCVVLCCVVLCCVSSGPSERTKLSPLFHHSFDAQNLNLGGLGAPFWYPGVPFGCLFGGLGPLGAHFGQFVGICQKFESIFHGIAVPFGSIFGPKSIQIRKKV